MKYYKIIKDDSFIGVIHSGQFVVEGIKKIKLFNGDEQNGQYVIFQGALYRDYWMAPIENPHFNFTFANITEVSQEDYEAYLEAIANNQPIIIDDDDQDEELPPQPQDQEDQDAMRDFIRQSKITQLSNACRQTIENGFDLSVHGIQRHFSLTTQDQLNLMDLSTLAQTQSLIPYHADGEECQFYTSQEINEIVAAATEFKIYHTTYYNALKIYVNALETIEEISAVEYGMEIPEEFKTNMLKIIES